MHPHKKNGDQILDFISFIKEFYKWYNIDGSNLEILKNINLWANRDPKFNGRKPGWHLDRGWLLHGAPGTGKDEIFRMLYRYLSYLGSPYVFSSEIVWQFSARFMSEKGYGCFASEGRQNRYYEELALTDLESGTMTREYVNHYGNKLLIGAELIHIVYNSFKSNGYQSHFSTNELPENLERIYGTRCYSRLREMCNFIEVVGVDRRMTNDAPVFQRNRNQPAQPPGPRETTIEEHLKNKETLEQCYRAYLSGKDLPLQAIWIYQMLWSYNVSMHTDEQMRGWIKQLEEAYETPIDMRTKGEYEQAQHKKEAVWKKAREVALRYYFDLLKQHNCATIFQEVEVRIDGLNSVERV